jgi:uncharacterized heparinase superfamily protein
MAIARLSKENGAAVLAAGHDGYLKRHGLMHNRRLSLNKAGTALFGIDRLEPPSGRLRLKQDLPFAIHFHLHPDCTVEDGDDEESVRIQMANGKAFLFKAAGAEMFVEESLFFAESSGPRPGVQIVLRGATFGETEVRWSATQV